MNAAENTFGPGDRVRIIGGLDVDRPTRTGMSTMHLDHDLVAGWGPNNTVITRWSGGPIDPRKLRPA